MTTHIFLPPLARGSGGLTVLRRMGRILHAAGAPVSFVLREPARPDAPAASEEAVPCRLPHRLLDELRFAPGDILLVPEGWPTALLSGLRAGARCIVYVQNWAYLLSGLPPGAEALPVEFLAVSDPVARFIEMSLGRRARILRPGIDPALFHPPAERTDGTPVSGPWRIAFMPRKNKALARWIREAVEARRARLHPGRALEWVSIEGCSQAEVAAHLRGAHVFLSTGFPEGCPLPPLEAFACGCIVAGFTGLGGWEYMRPARDFPGAARPFFPLRPVEWGGNGFYAADADVPGAVCALEAALDALEAGDKELAALRRAGRLTAAAYSLEEQERAACALWNSL